MKTSIVTDTKQEILTVPIVSRTEYRKTTSMNDRERISHPDKVLRACGAMLTKLPGRPKRYRIGK